MILLTAGTNPLHAGIAILCAFVIFALLGRIIAPKYRQGEEFDETDMYQ